MKNLLLSLFIFILSFQSFGQTNNQNSSNVKASNPKIIDSVVTYLDGNISEKTSFVYDGWGNLITKVNFEANSNINGWNKTDSVFSTFLKDGSRTIYKQFSFDKTTGDEIPVNFKIDTFKNGNNTIDYDMQNWSKTENDWTKIDLITREFNSQNLVTLFMKKSFTNNQWKNSLKKVYDYDANGNTTLQEIYMYDLNTGDIYGWSKTENTYDNNNNLTLSIIYSWNNGTWEYHKKTAYTYNSNNYFTSKIVQTWDGSDWVNSEKEEKSYNANNRMTLRIRWNDWDGTNWIGDKKYIYSYDSNDRETNYEYWKWDTNANTWKGYSKKTTDYSGDTKTETHLSWDSNNNVFRNSYQYITETTSTYNTEIYRSWDISNNVWLNGSKDEYLLTNGQTTTYNYYEWNTSTTPNDWEKLEVYSYQYDNHLIKEQYSVKNSNGSFLVQRNEEYTYDANGNAIYYLKEDFQNQTKKVSEYTYDTSISKDDVVYIGDLYNFQTQYCDMNSIYFNNAMTETSTIDTNRSTGDITNKTVKFYYSQAPVNIPEQKIISQAKVFPNPTSNLVFFSFDSQSSNNNLNIFDIYGKSIIRTNIENNRSVDLTNINSGIYIYKITTESGKIFEGKLVKK